MTSAKQKFARYLIMIVSSLGVLSGTILLSDPPAASDVNPSLFNVEYQKHVTGRSIAADSNLTSSDVMFEINCEDQNQKVETNSMRFRLRGRTCTPNAIALSTQIQNKSNGYIATVFHRDPQNFTTDYINLNVGENEIAVRFDTNSGAVNRKIEITRSPSSVKTSN